MSCLDSACHGVDIRVDICGVNDSITDRLETQLAAGGNSEGPVRTRARTVLSVGAIETAQGEARVQPAASLLHSHQKAQLVVAEQGPLSADGAVPVTGSQVRRGPSSGSGLAESKGR